jgi:FlaG/FlaF family flagellin (archaellin)
MISIKEKRESAVSPVIGILLMLVVTLIIAAVVSSFASGMAGDQQKAPQASIQVETNAADGEVIFDHKGGDSFDLGSVSVIFQSGDTKGTLSRSDIGTNCAKFERIGDPSLTMINSGDKFVITGTPGGGITFGSLWLGISTKCEWMVLDKASKATIAKGSFVVS